jgi:hypothetical protein
MAEKLERQRTYDRKQVKLQPARRSRFLLPDTRPTGRDQSEIPTMVELEREQAKARKLAKLASAVNARELSSP